MIRSASVKDIAGCIELARQIVPRIAPHYVADDQKLRRHLAFLIANKRSCVFVAEHEGRIVGVLAGQIMDLWFAKSHYATDLGFIVADGHGFACRTLAKRFIRWARGFPDVSEITLQISSGLPGVERLGAMYERLGLRHMGGCYSMFLESRAS